MRNRILHIGILIGLLFIGTVGRAQTITMTGPAAGTVCTSDIFSITVSSTVKIWFYIDVSNDGGTTWASDPSRKTIGGSSPNYFSVLSNFNISQTTKYQLRYTTTNPSVDPNGPYVNLPQQLEITLYTTPNVNPISGLACSGNPFVVVPANGNGNIIPNGTKYSWTIPTSNTNLLGASNQSVSQSSISQTLTNTTNVSQTIIYSVVPITVNNCLGDPFNATITINPTPTIAPKATSICSGGTFSVTLTDASPTEIVPAGTTYSWSAPILSGVTGALTGGMSGTGSYISGTLTNTTNSIQTATYTVTPTSADGCVGGTFTVTVTVKPRPNIANNNPPAICTGTSFVFTTRPSDIVPSNTQYTWTVTDNPNVNGDSNVSTPTSTFTQVLNNLGVNSEQVNYVVTPISDGCVGPSFASTVTLIPNPQITNPSRRTVCSGGDLSFTPTNGSDGIVPANTRYTWTIASNTNVTGQTEQSNPVASITGVHLVNSTLTNQDLNYSVTSSVSNGCASTTFQLIVTVVPVAIINNKDVGPVCSGLGFTVTPGPAYSDVVVPGTTYTWTYVDNPNVNGESGVSSPTSASSIVQTLTNLTNTVQSVVYNVTSVATTCAAANFTITAYIKPTPTIGPMSTTICSALGFELMPTNITNGIVPVGTTYTWAAPTVTGGITGGVSATDAGTISGTLTNPTNATKTATYSVTPKSADACTGGTFTVTVTVNPKATIADNTTTAICSATSFTFSSTLGDIIPVGTTYTWSNPSVTGGLTGAVSATGVGTISGTLTNPTNAPQTALYNITPLSGNCTGANFSMTVPVNPKATIGAKSPISCSGALFQEAPLNAGAEIVPVGTVYRWSNPIVTGGLTGGASGNAAGNFSGTLVNPTNAVQTATYTITPTSGFCDGGTFTATVTINPKATIQDISVSPRCSGLPFSVTPTNGAGNILPAGTTFDWNSPSVPALLTGGASGTATNTISGALTNSSSNTLTATYTVTPLSGTCPGGNFTVTAAYFPLPSLPTVVDKIVPYNRTAQYFDVTVPTGQSIKWYSPIDIELTGLPLAGPSYTNVSPTPYTVYVASKIDATGCMSDSKALAKLTINKLTITFSNSMIALSKVYDATAVATLSNTTLVGVIPADLPNINLHPQASFPSKNVGNNLPITETSYIDGVAAGNYSLTNTTGLTASITPKTIDEVGASYPASKVYDGTDLVNGYLSNLNPTELPGTGNAATDRKPYQGDDITLTSIAKYTDRIVGATKSVTSYSTIAGADANNYTLQKQTLSAAGITVKNLTMSGLSVPSSKVYDGTTDAQVTDAKTLLPSEPVGSGNASDGKYYTIDEGQVSLTGTPVGTYNSKDVTAANVVNYSNLTLTGASASNYTLTIQAGDPATITKKALTFTGLSVPATRVYNGNTTAVVSGTPSPLGTLQTSEAIRTGSTTDGKPYNIDVVALAGSAIGNYNTKDVLTANTVSFSGVVLTGAQSSNYSLTAHLTQTANITAKTISVTGAVASDKIYDATVNATVTGGTLVGVYPIDNSNVILNQSGTFADKNVANGIAVTANCSLSGADAPNYSLTQPILAAKNITPKELTMSGLTVPANKVYDATTAAVVSGTPTLQSAQTPGAGTSADGKPYIGDNLSIIGTATGTYDSKDVPTATKVTYTGLSLTGAQSANYTFKIQDPTLATIVRKKLTMSGLSVAPSKVYDGTVNVPSVSGTATLQSPEAPGTGNKDDGKPYTFAGGDDVRVVGTPIAVYNSKNVVGAVSVQFSGLSLAGTHKYNYDLSIQSDYPSTITPLTIHVTADPKTKVYGELDPAFTYVNDPIILGDAFTGALSRVVGQNVGSYSITQGSLDLGTNYNIIYQPANLVITEAALYIKPDTTYRIYGDAPLLDGFSTNRFVATGLQYNETIGTVKLYFPTGLGSGNDPKDPIGLYPFGVLAKDPSGGSALASNYRIVSFPGDIRVKPFPITITAEAKVKRQSQVDPPLTYIISRSPVNGDLITGALERDPGNEPGTYPIRQGTVAINDNYDITYVPNLFTVLTIENIFVLPNAFTPNSDGLNDVFKILYNSSVVSINYFKVYNKAGRLVFETRNIDEGWDGKVNGVVQDSDAYYWIAEYRSWNDKIFQRKGAVVLLK